MRSATVILIAAASCAGQHRFDASWESLDQRPTPTWFTDAKFGIFIHWGVYSVPSYAPVGAYSEWYWNALNKGRLDRGKPNSTFAFHSRVYGERFSYFDFAPMFRAELFDPAHWADVFEKSGARYVVPTSKHHDGFALWPSAEASRDWARPWNAVDIGPKRDLLGDLAAEVRKRGLRFGFYYSLYEWYNPLWLSDKPRFIREHMHPQFKDVVTRYKPAIIFSDGEWDLTSAEWKTPELLAWLFNESPVRDEVAVNDRWGKDTRHKHGGYFTTEYAAGLPSGSHPWEENRGMGFSFGYNRMEQVGDYRTARELILMLADLVSRGGNLLLDIGPTADGRIPVVMEERLLQIGDWLKRNGEAIYGTRPWKRTRQWSAGQIPEMKSGEFNVHYDVTDYVDRKKPGQAVIEAFFTVKQNDLYAIVPGWPGQGIEIRDVRAPSEMRVTLLGDPRPLRWSRSGSGIVVHLPSGSGDAAKAQYACVLKLTGLAR